MANDLEAVRKLPDVSDLEDDRPSSDRLRRNSVYVLRGRPHGHDHERSPAGKRISCRQRSQELGTRRFSKQENEDYASKAEERSTHDGLRRSPPPTTIGAPQIALRRFLVNCTTRAGVFGGNIPLARSARATSVRNMLAAQRHWNTPLTPGNQANCLLDRASITIGEGARTR